MPPTPRTCAACGCDMRRKWAGQRLGKQVLCLTCNAAGWNLTKGGPPKPPNKRPASWRVEGVFQDRLIIEGVTVIEVIDTGHGQHAKVDASEISIYVVDGLAVHIDSHDWVICNVPVKVGDVVQVVMPADDVAYVSEVLPDYNHTAPLGIKMPWPWPKETTP